MKITKTDTGYCLEPETSDEAQALDNYIESLRSDHVETTDKSSDC